MDIIEKRQRLYSGFPLENLQIGGPKTVSLYDIKYDLYEDLQLKTQAYLLKTLNVFYNKEFTWEAGFLRKNRKFISNLPNLSPNGVIFPRSETIEEFQMIHDSVIEIMVHLKINRKFSAMAVPNIRFKTNSDPEEVKGRPYYTNKLHSDAWVGHVGDSILLVGLLGDLKNNTVQFNDPLDVDENYLDKANSFEEGLERVKRSVFAGTLPVSTFGVMDHSCLHKTYITKNAEPRISLDMAAMVDSEYSLSHQVNTQNYTYYKTKDMERINREVEYRCHSSIFDFQKDVKMYITTEHGMLINAI
jgi:hypothetical protein